MDAMIAAHFISCDKAESLIAILMTVPLVMLSVVACLLCWKVKDL